MHTCEEGASCGAGRSSPLLSAVRSMTAWPSDPAPAAGRMSSLFEVLPLSTQLNLHCSHRSLGTQSTAHLAMLLPVLPAAARLHGPAG